MFYNMFCTIVSCSVIKFKIEEPSWTGRSESIQIFKHSSFSPSSLLCTRLMRSRTWIHWWLFFFFDSRNHLCCSSLYLFYSIYTFYSLYLFALNVWTRISIALQFRDVGRPGICVMGGSVFCFCSWNCRQWTQYSGGHFVDFHCLFFATWGLWWWWFLDPAVDLLSATVDWTCYSCFACCCVWCASQNIYLHWNSFATCFPTQQVYWYLIVVLLCHQDFYLCSKVWYHLQI